MTKRRLLALGMSMVMAATSIPGNVLSAFAAENVYVQKEDTLLSEAASVEADSAELGYAEAVSVEADSAELEYAEVVSVEEDNAEASFGEESYVEEEPDYSSEDDFAKSDYDLAESVEFSGEEDAQLTGEEADAELVGDDEAVPEEDFSGLSDEPENGEADFSDVSSDEETVTFSEGEIQDVLPDGFDEWVDEEELPLVNDEELADVAVFLSG